MSERRGSEHCTRLPLTRSGGTPNCTRGWKPWGQDGKGRTGCAATLSGLRPAGAAAVPAVLQRALRGRGPRPLVRRRLPDCRQADGAGRGARRPRRRVDCRRRLGYLGATNAPSAAQVAQLVEHATENRSVGGSIPPLGTISDRSCKVLATVRRPQLHTILPLPPLKTFGNDGSTQRPRSLPREPAQRRNSQNSSDSNRLMRMPVVIGA